MFVKTKIILLCTLSLTTSCSSVGYRDRILGAMAIAAVTGAVIGQTEKDHKKELTLMYAGTLSAITGAVMVVANDPDSEVKKTREQMSKMQTDFDAALAPKLENATSGMMNAKVPEKYRALINPGEWTVYEMDEWIEDSENSLIHQDKRMQLIPPSLKPGSQPLKEKLNGK